jgi:DNA helicase-2/ATP-dependent DNA helicase PcrA
VLPELGEEHIPEMGMEELAADLLERKFKFQSFFHQVSHLLEKHDAAFIERIRFKSSFEFLSKLNQYLIYIENNYFTFTELRVAGIVVPFPFIQEKFRAYHRVPLLMRFPEVVKDVLQYIRNEVKRKVTGHEKSKVWQAIPRMFKMNNLFDLYKDFYAWIGKEELFRVGHSNMLEYADVFPLIYFKIRLEGFNPYDHVKHLLVDEMQDYTPVQYAVLARVFNCKKTILGDVNQTVNPYSASSSETIHEVFPQGDTVKLFRSYRSTWEITDFAQNISRNPDIIPMERHGEIPKVKGFNSNSEEADEIRKLVEHFLNSGHQSLGIICKTIEQAEVLHHELGSKDIHLLTADSTSFKDGIVVTTTHLAKGLEFDEVIIPFASARNYQTDVDKSMLYIASTRAMHKLTLTYTIEKTRFIFD